MFKLDKLLGIKQDMDSVAVVKTDIYRYKRNKFASGLALLGIVFECLYFMLFYSLLNSSYHTLLVGFDIIINLAVLLVAFLSSEGVKGYNKKYCIPLLILGIVQIVRIFIYPVDIAAGGGYLYDSSYEVTAWYFGNSLSSAATSTILIIYLVLSAACLFASAVIGYIRAKQLEIFTAHLNDGSISVEDALAELDAQEESANVVNVAAKEV